MSDKEGRFTVKDLKTTGLCTIRAEEPYGSAGMASDVRPGDDVVVALTENVKPTGRPSIDNGSINNPSTPGR